MNGGYSYDLTFMTNFYVFHYGIFLLTVAIWFKLQRGDSTRYLS